MKRWRYRSRVGWLTGERTTRRIAIPATRLLHPDAAKVSTQQEIIDAIFTIQNGIIRMKLLQTPSITIAKDQGERLQIDKPTLSLAFKQILQASYVL
jgi:DNA-binding MarR family transcriptional regulator